MGNPPSRRNIFHFDSAAQQTYGTHHRTTAALQESDEQLGYNLAHVFNGFDSWCTAPDVVEGHTGVLASPA